MRRYGFPMVLSFCFLCCSLFSYARFSDTAVVYLSRYRFAAQEANGVLCRVLTANAGLYTLALTGVNADLFVLKGDSVLLSRRGERHFKRFERGSFSVRFTKGNQFVFERTFTILRDAFARNGVIAHRGVWKNTDLPQNSVASLQAACRMKCAGSEFDIRSTADGVLVICHDETYAGMEVEKTNYAELGKHPMKNGESLPTFESYLKAGTTQQQTRLIAEIKPSVLYKTHTLELTKKVMAMVEKEHAQAWMIYISFDYDALKEVQRLDPSAVTMYLSGDKDPAQLKRDGMSGPDYYSRVYHKQPEWIKMAHAEGLEVNVWTVDKVPEMEYFLDHSVEYITTNEPEILFSLLPKEP